MDRPDVAVLLHVLRRGYLWSQYALLRRCCCLVNRLELFRARFLKRFIYLGEEVDARLVQLVVGLEEHLVAQLFLKGLGLALHRAPSASAAYRLVAV